MRRFIPFFILLFVGTTLFAQSNIVGIALKTATGYSCRQH